MSTQTQTPENATPVATPETKTLAEVAADVAADSSRQPQAYLDQATVPHGGE